MALYLYAIIDSSGPVEPMEGVQGWAVYSIGLGGIAAVVSSMSPPMPPATRRAVLAHEAVVENLMERFTVLPVRFRTVLDGKVVRLHVSTRAIRMGLISKPLKRDYVAPEPAKEA